MTRLACYAVNVLFIDPGLTIVWSRNTCTCRRSVRTLKT